MKSFCLWCLLLTKILSMSMVKNDPRTNSESSQPEACGPDGVCKCGWAIKFYQVNCKGRSYQVVPKDILPNATKIVLADNSLEYIPNDVFRYTTDVNAVDLTRNRLTQLPKELFATTVHLERLQISYNLLTRLPTGMLANTPRLKVIELSSNELSTLPDDLFENKSFLETVVLCKNKLHTLSPGMFSTAPKLKFLFLGTNNISKFPDQFFKATPKLRYLSVPKNNFSNLYQSSLAGLTSINYISFALNNLSVLPADLFSGLRLNGSIDLSHNRITEIPQGLFSSNQRNHDVQVLYLQGNNLTFLRSNSFKGLHRLKYIFLNNNNISRLESEVFNDTRIQYIYMFGNALEHITQNVFGNEYIIEIHLYENEIQSISETALRGMSRNINLYLNCNKLNKIPWSSGFTNMLCVNSHFVPNVTFKYRNNTKLKTTLQKEGFVCTKTELNKIVYVSCQPCPPGKYGNGYGNCEPCQKGGFYQDKIGYRRCKKCHEGTFVNTSSASSLDQCRVCPEGTDQTKLANYRACFCKTNYSRINRFMECSFCFEEGVNCSFDYKFLRPGYYWNWSFPLTNMTAYAQFVTNLQTTDSSYDNSTIEYRGLMPYVQKCPNSESCLNRESHTVEALEGTCSDGYRGWLCYQCQSRYYRVLNTCRPCPDHWWAILEAVVLILLFCGVLYFLIWRSKDKRGNKGTKNEERSLADKVSSRMKIALGFYQVIGELFDSMHEINWVGPLSVVGKFLSFRNINIFELFIRPRCLKDNFVIDSKLEFKIALTLPVFVLATALLVYHICKLVMMFNKSQKPFAIQPRLNKLKSNVYSFILLLLFVTYTPTCDAIFALFPAACKSFNLYQNSTNYQNSTKTIELLRSDFDLPCDGSLYIYHISAYFATIYVITFPCTLLFVLRKYCKTTDPKPVVPYVQGEEVVCHERTRLLSDADRAAVPFWMKFLCENYKPRFWYWEIVELARKVTQTALVTLRGWDDALTILSTIGLSVLFLTLHAKFAPMKIPFEQRLQMFSLSAIFINILIVAVKIPPEYGVLISTLLILLNLIILLIITGEMALGILRFVRKKCFRNYSSGLDPILYADE